MWLRISLLVMFTAMLGGCSKNDPPAPKGATVEKLPAEVTGDPTSALPKTKGQAKRP